MRCRPISRYEPTGAIRFRIGRLGQLVLQLEFIGKVFEGAPPRPGTEKRSIPERIVWRDADKGDRDRIIRSGVFVPKE